MGHAGDYIRRIASEQALKAYKDLINQKNNSPQKSSGRVGCLNADRTKIKFEDGSEWPVTVIGNPTNCCFVQEISPGHYLAVGPRPQPISVYAGAEGLVLYNRSGEDPLTPNYYIRKVKSRNFYSFTPPIVNGQYTAALPPYAGLGSGIGQLNGTFRSKSLWFTYRSRLGGVTFGHEDLLDGELQVDYALLNPSFTQNPSGDYIVEYSLPETGTYKLVKGSISGCPVPNNNNSFVFSAGFEETSDSSTPASPYTNIEIVATFTYETDNDPGSAEEYTSTYQDFRTGFIPQDPGSTNEGGSFTHYINNNGQNRIDLWGTYLQGNFPFQAKRLQNRTVTWSGTYNTIFVEEYGPAGGPYTHSETPLSGNWSMSSSTDYTYAPSSGGFREVTATTTYSVTEAAIINYTPLGTGEDVDQLISGGPLGPYDLTTGTPPFGYISCYAHGPCVIATLGDQSVTSIYYLTNPDSDAFITTLITAETTDGDYLGDLPFENTAVEVNEESSYYAVSPSIGRIQHKAVVVESINSTPTIIATLYHDREFYTQDTTETTESTETLFFDYDNTVFGGSSSYSCEINLDIENTANTIETNSTEVENLNLFPYFDVNLQVPYLAGCYRPSESDKFIVLEGPQFLSPDNKLMKTNYDLSNPEILLNNEDGKLRIITSSLDRVEEPATFNIIDPEEGFIQGSFRLTTGTNKIVVLTLDPEYPDITDLALTFWIFNTDTESWTKRGSSKESFIENPLVFPPDTSVLSVSQFYL